MGSAHPQQTGDRHQGEQRLGVADEVDQNVHVLDEQQDQRKEAHEDERRDGRETVDVDQRDGGWQVTVAGADEEESRGGKDGAVQ